MTDIPPPKTDNPLKNKVTTLLEQINETSGEKQSALRTELLDLYLDSAERAYYSNQKTEAYQLLQRGLEHAQAFLNQGETASSVREGVLQLYVNMGGTLGQPPFSDAQQKLATYQRGLEHAQAFLKQGETASSVREPVLNLYLNMGVTLGQAPFSDAQQELATYQRGLEHAQAFLNQGETASSVREQEIGRASCRERV